VKEEMKRENISAEEARLILVKDDGERRRWSLALYGLDPWDQSLYDMTLHINTMDVEDAESIILQALQRPCFKTSPQSQELIDDLSLGAQVEAALIHEFPKVDADARNGSVLINIRASRVDEKTVSQKVEKMAAKVPGVEKVQVNIVPYIIES